MRVAMYYSNQDIRLKRKLGYSEVSDNRNKCRKEKRHGFYSFY
jgi:hypothetical protein